MRPSIRDTTAKILKDQYKQHQKNAKDIDLTKQYQELYAKNMPGVIRGSQLHDQMSKLDSLYKKNNKGYDNSLDNLYGKRSP